MSKIVYNVELLKIMRLFDSVTRSKLKDCFFDENDLLTFVVQKNEIGKAIGKGAANVKKLENLLKRKIKIVEFNPELKEFVENLLYPISNVEVEVEDGKRVTIKTKDAKTKGILIGRNASNLRNNENIVKKYFDIEEIKVI